LLHLLAVCHQVNEVVWVRKDAHQINPDLHLLIPFAFCSTKAVYISGMIYYGIGMLILGLWPTKWGVLVFSTSAGILYGTLFTMPFIWWPIITPKIVYVLLCITLSLFNLLLSF